MGFYYFLNSECAEHLKDYGIHGHKQRCRRGEPPQDGRAAGPARRGLPRDDRQVRFIF